MSATLGTLPAIIADLAGRMPESLEPLRGGRNNLVVRAEFPSGPLLVKAYFRSSEDPRDRLGAEFGLLSHIWRHGVWSVPEPLAADPERGVALYEFVVGEHLVAGAVTNGDVCQLAALLGRMWELRGAAGAGELGGASDAALRLADLLERLDERLDRLLAQSPADELDLAARRFLEGPFSSALAHERAAVRKACDVHRLLPQAERTLSPSDHGFHNALRVPGGALRFLDFEYGGFDDPAKMLADACLQPEVPLPADCRRTFVSDVLERLGSPPGLARRLRHLYPLQALQWCLIALNEFLPAARDRRSFARAGGCERRLEQLRRAESMLDALSDDLATNLEFLPYDDSPPAG